MLVSWQKSLGSEKTLVFFSFLSFIVIFFKSGNKSASVCETHHLIVRLEMCGQEALVFI